MLDAIEGQGGLATQLAGDTWVAVFGTVGGASPAQTTNAALLLDPVTAAALAGRVVTEPVPSAPGAESPASSRPLR